MNSDLKRSDRTQIGSASGLGSRREKTRICSGVGPRFTLPDPSPRLGVRVGSDEIGADWREPAPRFPDRPESRPAPTSAGQNPPSFRRLISNAFRLGAGPFWAGWAKNGSGLPRGIGGPPPLPYRPRPGPSLGRRQSSHLSGPPVRVVARVAGVGGAGAGHGAWGDATAGNPAAAAAAWWLMLS